MILTALSGLLKTFMLWFSELLPIYHLTYILDLQSTLNVIWDQVYMWSGVFPIDTIFNIIRAGLTIGTVLVSYSVFKFVLNIVRGSGA